MKNVTQTLRRWEIPGELIFPSLIFSILIIPVMLLLGITIGILSSVSIAAVAGTIIVAVIVLLRLDELTVTLIVAAHILVDSYLNFDVYQVAMLMALVLLFTCYLGRSVDHPWTGPRLIWLWILFLILNIYPTINGGAFGLANSIAGYLNLVLSAFIMFWLGNIIAKDTAAVRRVFQLLAVLATLSAIHTIIEATTGRFLLTSSYNEALLVKYSNFPIIGTGIFRSGSFFGGPNGNAAFLAVNFFLALALFIENKQMWAKMIYLLEALLILLALMFTYSTGAWIAVLTGMLAFIFLSGRLRYGVLLLMLIMMLIVLALTVFPSHMAVQLGHANNQHDLLDHLGTWQTAARVIQAFPLSGVGLGQSYLVLSNSFLAVTQARLQAEPDNSYLQWGAIAGIPVMLIFLLLLGYAFWFSWRNWLTVELRYRCLIGGGIAALITLSINSLFVDGWTNLSGIEYLGWLIAGVVASPLIDKTTKSTHVRPVPGISYGHSEAGVAL